MSDLFWLGEAQMARLEPLSRSPMASRVLMIDASYLKAHRTAWVSIRGGRGRLIGRSLMDQNLIGGTKIPEKGGRNTKLHAIGDNQCRPINLFISAGHCAK